MIKRLNYRVIIFLIALIFGIFFSMPSFFSGIDGKKITLGLDLQGGLHMLLGVKSEIAVKSKIKSVATSLKYNLEEKDILYDSLKIGDNKNITLEILDKDDLKVFNKILEDDFKIFSISSKNLKFTLTLTDESIEEIKEFAIKQAVDVIRNRLNQYGLSEPTVAKQGKDKILVEVPGIKTAEDESRIRALIAKPAYLQMMAIDEDRDSRVDNMTNEEAEQYGDIILKDVSSDQKYLVYAIPILNGSMLTDARVSYSQDSNQPVIVFSLNGIGSKIFGDFSGKNIGKRMAIVLDNQVYSDPVFQERIGGGKGQISGNFTAQEASDVAIALRSGSLLAPVQLEEKRSIGPSLGADSIKSSSIALICGFILVVIFMYLYYGISGLISNLALICNLFLILAIMSISGATLTLPGMAGVVLTVGMAVDANVIINERIRELLLSGKSIYSSIEDGYKNAFNAIWDANITTLLAAIILYAYGTGAIKGFSLTISIGILASMLTAILGTHGIYQYLLPKINKNNLNKWFGIKIDNYDNNIKEK